LVCFRLFQLVSVFRTYIETTETNRTVSKQTETTLSFLKNTKKKLSIKLFLLVFCLFRFNRNIETLCFGIEPKQPKQTVSKQTKTNRNNPKFVKKIPKYALITLFQLLFCVFRFNRNTETLCFGIEPKQTKQSAETSFGSSFGCFESKLVSKYTLV
jgi:hypothetical protein